MKIFISSTAYDLFDIRSFLVQNLENLGHTVLYNESPTFPAKLNLHSHDQCLEAVKTADLVICLIDKRYGGNYSGKLFDLNSDAVKIKLRDEILSYKYKDLSITWMELITADKAGIPIITFARYKTLDEKAVRRKNQNVKDFRPAYVEKIQVFDFLDWITQRPLNNWIVSFYNFLDFQTKIEICMKELEKSIIVNNSENDISQSKKVLLLVEGPQDRDFVKNLINNMKLNIEFLIIPTYGKLTVLRDFNNLISDNLSKFDHVLILLDSDYPDKEDENFREKFNQLAGNNDQIMLFFAIENIESWIKSGVDQSKLDFAQKMHLGNKNKLKKNIHSFVENHFDLTLAETKSQDFKQFTDYLRKISLLSESIGT